MSSCEGFRNLVAFCGDSGVVYHEFPDAMYVSLVAPSGERLDLVPRSRTRHGAGHFTVTSDLPFKIIPDCANSLGIEPIPFGKPSDIRVDHVEQRLNRGRIKRLVIEALAASGRRRTEILEELAKEVSLT